MSKLIKFLVCVVATIFAVNPGAAEETANWVVVDLETPGNLGVEILYQADKLSDVTHLRVSGRINSTDWTTIKNLSNIEVLDMENTITESVPASTFDGRKSLVSINFPKTLNTIGNYAFRNTSIDEAIFPASLETIGGNGFSKTKIKNIKFAEGSKLKSLGGSVFSECDSLISVTFPLDAEITTIPSNTFSDCDNLSNINLPENITEISESAFRRTKNLSHIDLPGNLISIGRYAFNNSGLVSVVIPKYVNYVGYGAFSHCENLQEVELSTSLHSIEAATQWDALTFDNCKNIKKVICKSSTPPSVSLSYPPFSASIKSNITLVVPDFAVPDYKLNTYWLGFGEIVGGAKSDYWDIAGKVSLTNDRRMEGTPSITIQTGGSLNVSGNSAMPMDHLNMIYKQSSQNANNFRFSQLINSSPLMTANSVEVTYSILSYYWHFVALPFDVKVGDIRHSDPSAEFAVRYYDGAARASANKTGNSWKDVPAGTVIKAGTGFIIQANKEGVVTFTCADDGKSTIFNPNSFELELAANTAESSAHSGWNLVANPFPCYYDMYYSMLSCPITVYDTYNRKYIAYSLIDDEVVLWPNRPFFIQASDDVKGITFSTLGRQLSAEVNRPLNSPSVSRSASERSLFNISLSYNGLSDAARVVFNPDASDEYEISRDASKFLSENTDIPQLYTITANEDYLAINERDEADGLVRVGFFAPAAGEMSLTMSRIDGEASLRDAVTGETVGLTEGVPYEFVANEAGFDNTRFTLMLKKGGQTGVKEINDEERSAVATDGKIVRVSNAAGKEVVITSVDGKVFVNETAKADAVEYTMPCGIYIVKAGASTAKCLIK